MKRYCFVLFLIISLLKCQSFQANLMRLPQAYPPVFISNKKQAVDSDAFIFTQIDRYFDTRSFSEKLPDRYQKTYEDVIYLQLLSASVVVALWFLPENVSKWNHSELQESDIVSNWIENVKTGPVVDEDEPWINYGGHSLSGAYFYTLARNNDLSITESMTFNFLMSTFYWEYGVEAFFEIPSNQDLWITPILGSILGESFYQMQQTIRANEGKVWGSESLGSFFMVFLNPEGALANFLRTNEDRVDFEIVSRFYSYIDDEAMKSLLSGYDLWMESYLGFEIRVQF